MENNIFVYGPFVDMNEQRKIAIGTSFDKEVFMQEVSARNHGYIGTSGCDLKDLGVTSMKGFYKDGLMSENVSSEFKIGSSVYHNCKELFLLRRYSDVENLDNEFIALVAGNSLSDAAFYVIDHFEEKYPHLMHEKIVLDDLDTKVNFGGLIALFTSKEK